MVINFNEFIIVYKWAHLADSLCNILCATEISTIDFTQESEFKTHEDKNHIKFNEVPKFDF